jgi:hypothetical protein
MTIKESIKIKELLKKEGFDTVGLFLNENSDVVHIIGYEGYPNIATFSENFEELQFDKEFGLGEEAKSLFVAIVSIEEFVPMIVKNKKNNKKLH